MKPISPRRAQVRRRGNLLFQRFYSDDYLPRVTRVGKQKPGHKKLLEFIRSLNVRKKGKGFSLTHRGFFQWMLSRGAPKGWDELSAREQHRWADRIVHHIIEMRHEHSPRARVSLRDPIITSIKTGKPVKFAFGVDQDLEDITDAAHMHIQLLRTTAERLQLSPAQQEVHLKKIKRVANLYTIYLGIDTMLEEGKVTLG